MKILFFGSDDFACAHLKALAGSRHSLVGCVTQPDRPKGRGMNLIVSPVKEYALKQGITVLQPVSVKEDAFIEQLRALQCDVFVVIAYGQFLPSTVFRMPSFGAINVHASLLPKYRGAAPINWAIINGERETGLSIIKINETMDGGDIVAEKGIKMDDQETSLTLRAKMAEIGPKFLLETIDGIEKDAAIHSPKAQDENRATYAPKLTKELGRVQWNKSAQAISRLVRGLLPWPGAYAVYQDKFIKLLEVEAIETNNAQDQPGTVCAVDKSGIIVAAGEKFLLIKKVHLQNSKPMDAHAFVVGHELGVGFKFQ